MQDIDIIFWIIFHATVGLFLLVDLLSRGRIHEVTLRKDVAWSIIWITIGLAFSGYVILNFGYGEGFRYITAYVVEKALSVDNLFVFIVIFNYFSIPVAHQHKTLFLGIVAAIILRGVFIFAGIALLENFSWMVYVFGVILLYSGYKLSKDNIDKVDPEQNRIVKIARRFLKIDTEYTGGNFLVRNKGKLMFTPLILALLAIETTDVVFAFDSVPAVLALTDEFFTAYTSNILAILGMRSLYFVLARVLRKLQYLSKGLAVVLIYLGAKFLVTAFGVEIPTALSLVIVLGIILVFALASLMKTSIKENK